MADIRSVIVEDGSVSVLEDDGSLDVVSETEDSGVEGEVEERVVSLGLEDVPDEEGALVDSGVLEEEGLLVEDGTLVVLGVVVVGSMLELLLSRLVDVDDVSTGGIEVELTVGGSVALEVELSPSRFASCRIEVAKGASA